MEAEGDVIDAVFGDGQDYLEITSTAPFYQHEMGGNSANELQRADVFTIDGLKYDSWVTIGYEDNYMNALTAFLMDFTEFEQGGKLYTNNGAWFVTPDMRQAAAGPDGKLLLMQLTTEGEVRGVITCMGGPVLAVARRRSAGHVPGQPRSASDRPAEHRAQHPLIGPRTEKAPRGAFFLGVD